MFKNIFEGEPDFINEIGTKWWLDSDTTNYARKNDKNGISLNVTCYFIETTEGYKSRVLVSEDVGIIEEDQTLEGLAIKIDIRKFLKLDHSK
jgi:hypothetical protein